MKTSEMCLFEGILEKLSKSKYIENFILKGGLLISFLIGVDIVVQLSRQKSKHFIMN